MLKSFSYCVLAPNDKYNTKLVSWKDATFEFRTIDLSKEWREIENDLINII